MADGVGSLGGQQNSLLSRLAAENINLSARSLQRVDLRVHDVLHEPGQLPQYAYFLEVGMASIVSIMEDGRSIEVGTVGSEGVVGALQLLTQSATPYKCFIQLAGHGFRIPAASFIEEVERNERLRELVESYHVAFLTQTMQTAACNGLHSVQQRCCRWILMSHDRARTDTFGLTHEFLGLMLGVRRASVSDVLGPMQERGWISSSRGMLTVQNRSALEDASCECYGLITEHSRRYLS